ncbi:hypothetical protein HanPI659440_Chr02g0081721 [Helianthus annuus]|nr:hypothetical protein HanPI659440_Chr02g0081721 [Helianthus annuus]
MVRGCDNRATNELRYFHFVIRLRGGGLLHGPPGRWSDPTPQLATSQCCLAVNTSSRAESVSLWEEGGRIPPAWTRTRVSMKSRGGTGQLGHPSWFLSLDLCSMYMQLSFMHV